MSYYEDVYLARLNKDGETKQERVIGARKRQFDNFLPKSIYKVDFMVDYKNYIGSLQPGNYNEKNILSYLLVPTEVILNTGNTITIGSDTWLVILVDPSKTLGYNKYKVIQLNRTFTWWDRDNIIHESKVNFRSSLMLVNKDQEKTQPPFFRELNNYSTLIMAYDESLQSDCYGKIDGSDRRFLVTGFDIETVPNVQYVTLDITMVRDDASQTTTPSSFWG